MQAFGQIKIRQGLTMPDYIELFVYQASGHYYFFFIKCTRAFAAAPEINVQIAASISA